MKLSIFTTLTLPKIRGDLLEEPLDCYAQLADEIICIDGSIGRYELRSRFLGDNKKDPAFYKKHHHKYKTPMLIIPSKWEQEFDWAFIGEQFQRGYEACIGDWVIHADLDFIFHERDYNAIRQACLDNNDQPALSFWKYQFILPDRYNLKSRLVIAVNKGKFGNRIKFNSGGDLCQPSLDGEYINPNHIPEARIPFYCYEKILKTKEQIAEDCGRMERAYKRHFGKTQYGSDGSNEDAFDKWLQAQQGKFKKPQKQIPLTDHPKVMQETISLLEPKQFGYNGFGIVKGGVYC